MLPNGCWSTEENLPQTNSKLKRHFFVSLLAEGVSTDRYRKRKSVVLLITADDPQGMASNADEALSSTLFFYHPTIEVKIIVLLNMVF